MGSIEIMLFKEVIRGLRAYYPNADDTQKVILDSAMVAAGADAIGGIIPGLAIPATIVACFGAVWVMYGRLCSTLGISLRENVLKLLARAVLANIAGNLGGVFAASFVGMFIPFASILVSAAVVFVTVGLAGLIFLRMILSLAKKSSDPYTFSDLSESEMESTARYTNVSKGDFEAMRGAYRSSR